MAIARHDVSHAQLDDRAPPGRRARKSRRRTVPLPNGHGQSWSLKRTRVPPPARTPRLPSSRRARSCGGPAAAVETGSAAGASPLSRARPTRQSAPCTATTCPRWVTRRSPRNAGRAASAVFSEARGLCLYLTSTAPRLVRARRGASAAQERLETSTSPDHEPAPGAAQAVVVMRPTTCNRPKALELTITVYKCTCTHDTRSRFRSLLTLLSGDRRCLLLCPRIRG